MLWFRQLGRVEVKQGAEWPKMGVRMEDRRLEGALVRAKLAAPSPAGIESGDCLGAGQR